MLLNLSICGSCSIVFCNLFVVYFFINLICSIPSHLWSTALPILYLPCSMLLLFNITMFLDIFLFSFCLLFDSFLIWNVLSSIYKFYVPSLVFSTKFLAHVSFPWLLYLSLFLLDLFAFALLFLHLIQILSHIVMLSLIHLLFCILYWHWCHSHLALSN
jgi:hypothetical protein